MSAELDLDDVAATSPLAARELAELRADRDRYSDMLDISQGVVRELRARIAELERQLATGDYDYTVDEICNAYESGVGHRGRPTAHVNPYKPGSDLATAYAIGAVGDREAQIAEPAASRALDMLTSAALDHYTPHMVCVPSTAWSAAMRVANAAPADHSEGVLDMVAPAAAVPDCDHCGGTGDVSGEYPGVACQACDGTGKCNTSSPEDMRKTAAYALGLMDAKDMLSAPPAAVSDEFTKQAEGCLYEPPAPAQDVVRDYPEGWVFHSADFSINASCPSRSGRVTLVRDVAGRDWWISLSDEEKEREALYAYGSGNTLAEAICDASEQAALLAASKGEKP